MLSLNKGKALHGIITLKNSLGREWIGVLLAALSFLHSLQFKVEIDHNKWPYRMSNIFRVIV